MEWDGNGKGVAIVVVLTCVHVAVLCCAVLKPTLLHIVPKEFHKVCLRELETANTASQSIWLTCMHAVNETSACKLGLGTSRVTVAARTANNACICEHLLRCVAYVTVVNTYPAETRTYASCFAQWIPTIIEWLCRSVAISIAWWCQWVIR